MTDPAKKVISMTEAEMRLLIRQTVSDTLTSLGIDHGEPHEMQKDFLHLREQRISSDAVKKKFQLTLVVTFLTGIIALIIMGVKEYFKS